MAATIGIPNSDTSLDRRLVPSLDAMRAVAQAIRAEGQRIVLTSGSFDLIHLGHVKYLAKAKEYADVLVVGVDSDAKIRRRKGEGRPMVPERERLELLAHQRPVDLLFLKEPDEPRWGLIRAVQPDVLVVSEDHGYSEDDQRALGDLVGELVVLERMASVTTSERIRQMYLHMGERIGPNLADALGPKLAEALRPTLADLLPDLIDDMLRR
jgi:D-beta-D-heptose 7-phosphate kinase/D-beta-D-heptose 1-phosphate adenosyltransferase